MNINGWTIEIEKDCKAYFDKENNRVAVLTKDDDEIHLTVDFDAENNLVLHPRWNVNITLLGEKKVKISTNSND